MSDVIEVEATPVENELDTLSKAEKWLAGASELVAKKCELYKPPETVTNDDELNAVREARASCRKDYQQIDAERKAMLKDMEDRLKSFKAQVKDVLSPLDDLDKRYKALVDAYDEKWRESRKKLLREHYEAIAPGIACRIIDEDTGEVHDPLVPFDLLLQRYGMGKDKWTNRISVEKVKGLVADAVYDIGENEKSIDCLVPVEDREEVKALYFSTLDINGAMAEARRLKDQRERVRAMETARVAAAIEPEPQPEPEPEPSVEPAQEKPPVTDVPHAWTISIPSATRQQMLMVAEFMRTQGITFDRIYSGNVTDAFRKENFGE